MAPNRVRSIAQQLALMAASLLIALTAIEIGVRVFSPAPPLMYVPDAALGWVHPRNADFTFEGNSGHIRIHYNDRGLRGPDRPYAKPPDTYRILVLGDSYPEGADVQEPDIFTSRIEAALRNEGDRVEVINGGVGGYGTDQEALFLDREGWKYSPDLLLLSFTIDNDVNDNASKGYCRAMPDGMAACAPPGHGSLGRQMLISAKAFLQAHYQTYFFLEQRTSRLYAVRLALQKLGVTEYKNAEALQRRVSMPLSLFLRHEPPDVTQGWTLTQSILTSITESARRHAVDVMIVLVPAEVQLDDAAFAAAVREVGLTPADFDLRRPDVRLEQFAEAHSIPIVDVVDEFRARQAGGERLVQGHWNSRGHAVVADAVVDALRRRVCQKLGRC